eukprot:scaffold4869_cov183-Amphora_coffeaeformis.AAC.15
MTLQANEDFFFCGEDVPDGFPSTDGWQDDFGTTSISKSHVISDEAFQNGQLAFDRLYNRWNDNSNLVPGGAYLFDMLTPDAHLVRRVFTSLNQYVKSHDGWSLRRREATEEERYMYSIKRKSKVYFIQAEYKVPLLEERVHIVKDTFEDTSLPFIDPFPFAKSTFSAFSPAAQLRLHDSTNAGATKQRKKSKNTSTRVRSAAKTNNNKRADPNRCFVPLVRTPARSTKTSPTVRRPLPLASKSPLSPYMPLPESSIFSSFSDEVLLAAPQNTLPGGFVYGDIVLILPDVSPRRAMVVGSATTTNDSEEDRLIVSVNLERLEVSAKDLKLVKGMPRWNGATGLALPPIPNGRSHLPK